MHLGDTKPMNNICQPVKYQCYPYHINIKSILENINSDISRKDKPYLINLNFIRVYYPEDIEVVVFILLEAGIQLYKEVQVKKGKNNIMEYYLGYYH